MKMSSLMSHMHVGVRAVSALAAFFVAVAAPARAGVMPPDYGFQWATVGGGTNRPANAQELAGSQWGGVTFPFNSVSYEYRIAKTEVTNAQWVEFYRAIRQFVSPLPSQVSAGDIINIGGRPTVQPGREQWPAIMGWEFAARYCNWLHNGKAMTREAFEQGVYDTSTFFRDENFVAHHNTVPAAGAKFWIPTFDEWVKAAYWDPNKNNGEGGYWRYPNSSDTPLVQGLPGMIGAQTAAGLDIGLPVGSFPNERSPWGLLDLSGGVQEYTSTAEEDPLRSGVLTSNSSNIFFWEPRTDQFGGFSGAFFDQASMTGLRLASIVPSPSGAWLVFPFTVSWAFRRSRFR